MSENSKIQWTDHTWNPWIGCTKVSAGCDNCYAENLMDRRYRRVQWGAGNPRSITKTWGDPVKWNKQAKESGDRPRVFCASLADIFDAEAPREWRRDAFNLIRDCNSLDWLLLTKRINIAGRLLNHATGYLVSEFVRFYPHIIWGSTIENQEALERRSDALQSFYKGGARTFYSVEPMLGPIDLKLNQYPVSWVIVGGESGANARPFNLDWARDIQEQCRATSTPFFFKQTGSNCWDGDRPVKVAGKGGEWEAIPEDLRIREFYRMLELAR